MEEPQRMGIYIHIPFCVQKCGYCDFLSFPVGEACGKKETNRLTADKIERYVEALCQEIRAEIPAWTGIPSIKKQQVRVPTVFFGGGTPSLLSGEQIGRILDEIKQQYPLTKDAEITMEANPGTLTPKKLTAYRQAGINRLSIGLQSAQNTELERLGRIHTWEVFLENFQAARRAGFDNLNIDLMSALPEQTLASWEDTLKKVGTLQPEHISAYSLILEKGTPFYQLYETGKQAFLLPDEDTERRMYEMTEDYLKRIGLYRYEISNYARPGYECRHNSSYWQRIPYLGLGLGASSFWGEVRWKNQEDLEKYLQWWTPTEADSTRKTAESSVWQEIEPLSVPDQMAEMMFLGLRMTEGIREEAFYQAFGQRLWQVYGTVLTRQERMGLIEQKDGRIRLTQYGRDVSNQVFWEYLS